MTALNSSPQNSPTNNPSSPLSGGTYLTIRNASKDFGIPTWKLYRAVKTGLLQQYHFLNGRKYVSRLDILALFQNSIEGGR